MAPTCWWMYTRPGSGAEKSGGQALRSSSPPRDSWRGPPPVQGLHLPRGGHQVLQHVHVEPAGLRRLLFRHAGAMT